MLSGSIWVTALQRKRERSQGTSQLPSLLSLVPEHHLSNQRLDYGPKAGPLRRQAAIANESAGWTI